ncbi:hypothetical protein CYK70_09600 [Clostridium perfringens]|uniref:phage terminase small subunit n=1 Tax=Clostridium perfringens TaxID=1502 RepID=UPI000D718281|nr:phage terminase small subunit [Clostridium perfringens]PWX07538.1 hypothetical protein CYK70_09600 [Clostridium perfringens]
MELREKALELFIESKGKLSSQKIADELGVSLNKVRNWRKVDKWKDKVNKRGAPIGNKNALGNKGGAGAKKGNVNAYKHGIYFDESKRINKAYLEKILPKALVNIMVNIHDEDPIDKLWKDILILETKIINMQKINYVKSKNDMTKVLKKETKGDDISSKEYEIQFAWDKENATMSTLSKAMDTLAKMIKQYDEMIHKNWNLVTEEQKLRIEKLKAEIIKLNVDDKNSKEDKIDSYFGKLEETIKNVE